MRSARDGCAVQCEAQATPSTGTALCFTVLKHEVDERVAGFGFRVVAVVRLLVGRLSFLDFRTQLGDLGVLCPRQLLVLGQRLGMSLVLCFELRRKRGDFLPALRGSLGHDPDLPKSQNDPW